MTIPSPEFTARALVAPGKGILAADESFPTIEKRFKALGIASTEVSRRDYREMLFAAPGLGEFISGAILFDETLRQKSADGPGTFAAIGPRTSASIRTRRKRSASLPGRVAPESARGSSQSFSVFTGRWECSPRSRVNPPCGF